ncbi:A/G-specific adenine glycosylase [Methylohalomonas lacus]|uniref:Adenine DNA glycosylase n=1 Tax=Methylohalomonas lacus TaxID=398773 RepID=A0AAE3HMX6_9GAMM|nr:A/G-specific adenine glycosylase [Methylohalomonas lacus]MCS3904156.1 A/G-specific adenine glycosylase [Methylohalomonas lacus]
MTAAIAPRLLRWAKRHGRHDLPWQRRSGSRNRIAYRVWVAEIMLQQTQVATVIPYFQRFMRAFPSVRALADAPLDDVLAHWSGLGYYARARNLHRAARLVRDEHRGRLPTQRAPLETLPGIGRSTAAAIVAQTDGQPEAILDGNVKRVLARYHAVPGWPGETAVARQLWTLAEQETPQRDVAAYTQAIMDLGATVCTRRRPGCETCPLAGDCQAYAAGRVGDYPGARPQRQKPQRRRVFAVLWNNAGKIMLTRRAPTGIWGGLWCLPEWPDEASCRDWLAGYGLTGTAEPLAPIEHAFTHFRLQLVPLQAVIRRPRRVADAASGDWYSLDAALRLGLPAPIRSLLASLQTQQQENQDGAHGALRKTG